MLSGIAGVALKALGDLVKGLIVDFWKEWQVEKLRQEAHKAAQLEKSLASAKEAAEKARQDQEAIEAKIRQPVISDDDWNKGK